MFEVGDKILVIQPNLKPFVGKIGVITGVVERWKSRTPMLDVTFDEFIEFMGRVSQEWSMDGRDVAIHVKNDERLAVGDRVRVINQHLSRLYAKEGTIETLNENGWIKVQFDHDVEISPVRSKIWPVTRKDIEKVSYKAPTYTKTSDLLTWLDSRLNK